MAQISNLPNKDKRIIFISLLLIVLRINIITSQNCEDIHDLTNIICFNGIIPFNHNKWRAGHGSINNYGDLILEFSLDYESDLKLFYGLKKNGRNYFGNSVFKEIRQTNCQEASDTCTYKGRYASENLFVSLSSDIPTTKQYLFSMSSGNSLVELIDIENNLNYFAWSSTNFFNLDQPIFSYKLSLFEIDNSNIYITVFSKSLGYRGGLEVANSVELQKFRIE